MARAIAERGPRLGTVVRPVVTGLLVMVNAVRSRHVVRVAIVDRVPRLMIVALRVVTARLAMANAVRMRRVGMLRVVRTAIVGRVPR